jgi:hypothetical protein
MEKTLGWSGVMNEISPQASVESQLTEKQPALIPPSRPPIGDSGTSPSFVTIRLYSLNHMNRNPWFVPCFIAVAAAWTKHHKSK